MPKLKIVHKGLILVAAPLIFGIGFISVLYLGLLDVGRHVDREILLKDALISHLSTMTSGLCGLVGQQLYQSTQDPAWRKYYLTQEKRAFAQDKHVRTLLKDEKDLSIPPFEVVYNTMKYSLDHKAETTLSLWLRNSSQEESDAASRAIESLRLILWGGVLAGISISSVLAVFLCLNFTNRLLIIVNNALSLSQGTPLSPPFKGEDEIAELDQFLYKSATEIKNLSDSKRKWLGL